jgi:glycosyltransferase involved in cell wall biosynthesis
MKPSVSIVIPAYNSAQRIAIPLDALSRQDAPSGSFEIIVVDNASSDGTSQFAVTHPAKAALAQRGIDLRTVREERKGLTFARIRGIREAVSDIICFLDDDTSPELDYVTEGLEAFADPGVGMLISRVYPKYEIEPPPSIARRTLFAINHELGSETIEWGPEAAFAPTVGAGMWIRRDLFLAAVPWKHPEALLSDRNGENLVSGGDIEIGYLIGRTGYKRVYCPRLKLWHHISKSRLNTKYFMRLIVGIVRSQITLNDRYGVQRYGLGRRLLALAELTLALVSLPFLLVRKDGFREALFVLTSRYARVLGAYDAPEAKGFPKIATVKPAN